MMGARIAALSFCSGVGGLDLGLSPLGVRTVGYCEIDPFAREILLARQRQGLLDYAPVYEDIRAFDGAAWRGAVDLVHGGIPCQPSSSAGKRRGREDERWLWPAFMRVVAEVDPSFVLIENVPGLLSVDSGAALGEVLGELGTHLAKAGGGSVVLRSVRASDAGAPHRRERVWILGARGLVLDWAARRWFARWDGSERVWRTCRRELFGADGRGGIWQGTWPRATDLVADADGNISAYEAIDVDLGGSGAGWPTPTVEGAAECAGAHRGRPDTLYSAVHWPTPLARYWKDSGDMGRLPLNTLGRLVQNVERGSSVDKAVLRDWASLREKWQNGNGAGVPLAVQAKEAEWPTVCASDGTGGHTERRGASDTGRMPDGSKVTVTLLAAVRTRGWSTPTGDDANNVTRESGSFQSLARDVGACDEKNSVLDGSDAEVPAATRGGLNPAWVESLVGVPMGWTDPEIAVDAPPALVDSIISGKIWPGRPGEPQHAWEPPRTIQRGVRDVPPFAPPAHRYRPAYRTKRLKALGNIVVPAQARLAVALLLAVLRRG